MIVLPVSLLPILLFLYHSDALTGMTHELNRPFGSVECNHKMVRRDYLQLRVGHDCSEILRAFRLRSGKSNQMGSTVALLPPSFFYCNGFSGVLGMDGYNLVWYDAF
mmetsp:Transcript_27394/g.55902  ORF Transcript_27394/g.55902 Transcript_27394/m.55902 type:complete len:107 (-) Transcript_27394:79-399(-)